MQPIPDVRREEAKGGDPAFALGSPAYLRAAALVVRLNSLACVRIRNLIPSRWAQ